MEAGELKASLSLPSLDIDKLDDSLAVGGELSFAGLCFDFDGVGFFICE